MRDLYQVLDLPEDADDSQLKKAYRKSALQWHPDKNQDRLEEADVRFKEIQNAYEILSDKHERSWYDSHRDQILRAGSHQAGGGSDGASAEQAQAPEDTFLYQFFSSSCYSGFSDGPKGFFTVFGEVFAKLARAEAEAAERASARGGRGNGSKGGSLLPGFGGSQAPWAEVSAFYQAWLHFVSDREFAWADAHNLASAPNRKVRRLMDEDNRKRRRGAKKEFQDTVRDLAAFVRKRDPRVAAWRAAEDAHKAERAAAEQQRREEERQARMQRAAQYQAPAWAEPDAGAAGSDGDASEDAAFGVADELYCVACDKLFRSANAMANHERSKKHLENAATLRAAMELEEEELSPDEAPKEDSADEPGGSAHASADEERRRATDVDSSGASAAGGDGTDEPEERAQENGHSREGDRGGRAFDERAGHERGASAAAARPADENGDVAGGHGRSSSESPGSSGQEEHSDYEGSLDEEAMLARMLQAHARVRRPKARGRSSANARGGREESLHPAAEAGPPGPESAGGFASEQETGPARDTAVVSEQESHGAAAFAAGDEQSSGPMLDGGSDAAHPVHAKPAHAAQQADMRIHRQDIGAQEKKPKSKKDRRKAQEAVAAEQGLLCSVCKAQFESRNQLFKHIAAKGHAQRK